jgi:hypothetical protein
MNSIRILHVLRSIDPSGGDLPRVAVRIAAEQVSVGHHVTLVTMDATGVMVRAQAEFGELPGYNRIHIYHSRDRDSLSYIFGNSAMQMAAPHDSKGGDHSPSRNVGGFASPHRAPRSPAGHPGRCDAPPLPRRAGAGVAGRTPSRHPANGLERHVAPGGHGPRAGRGGCPPPRPARHPRQCALHPFNAAMARRVTEEYPLATTAASPIPEFSCTR